MEDRDTCPVCFETFTLPKLLPCKHSFCLQCIKDYCSQINDQNKGKTDELSTSGNDQREIKNEIVCPLCRNPCQIPKNGLHDLLTNHFVNVSRPQSICEICNMEKTTKFCITCSNFSCWACYHTHEHVINKESEKNETESRDPILPIHLLFAGPIKTEYIGEFVRTFNLDIPRNEKGIRMIYNVCASKTGGAYVLTQTSPFIFKFDEYGVLHDKIRNPDHCSCITELENEDILGIFRHNRLILRYSCGGWSFFAETQDYFPLGLAELSDGKIVVSGGINLLESNDAEPIGIILIYSKDGNVLGKIDKKDKESPFLYPNLAVSNKVKKTFAIGDLKRNTITIFHETGHEITTYNGGNFPFGLSFPLPGMDSSVNFDPIEMCCSPLGNFVISCSDGTLRILDSVGKFRGISLVNCADGFGFNSDIAIDTNGKLWCSNSEHGTIRIFRVVKYKNHLNWGTN